MDTSDLIKEVERCGSSSSFVNNFLEPAGYINCWWNELALKYNVQNHKVLIKQWRNLLFDYIENFHKGKDYQYFKRLQFMKSLTEMLENGESDYKVEADVTDFSDPDQKIGPFLKVKGYETHSNVILRNKTKHPIIIHDMTNLLYDEYSIWSPFLLLPGMRVCRDHVQNNKTTITWSKFGSPIPPKMQPIEVNSVIHQEDCVVFTVVKLSIKRITAAHPHQAALSSCSKVLIENMQILEILVYLRSRGQIAAPMIQDIKAEKSEYRQNDALVTWLETQPVEAYRCFCDALDESLQSNLAKLLREQYT